MLYSQVVAAGEEYQRRLKDREAGIARCNAIHIRVATARLGAAFLIAFTAWQSIVRHRFPVLWTLLPLIIFVLLVGYHTRISRTRERLQQGASFYRTGLDRIEGRWVGKGQPGERFNDPHHVYAADLDLFGHGGIFELISVARTRMGEENLAKWLLSPSAVDEIKERHAALYELRDQLDLREDLAVLGGGASAGVFPEELVGWAETPGQMRFTWLQWLAPLLALAAVAGAVVWWHWGISTPFLLIVLTEAFLSYPLRKRKDEVLYGSEKAFRDLELLSAILARIETQSFRAARLDLLRRELASHGIAGFRAVARLRNIVDLIDSRDNLFLRILDIPLMYSVQVAFAAERWKRAHGHAVRSWLSVVGEFEALLSLAGYSYERADDPFPEFVEGAASFNATGMGHPLIPDRHCVRNSFFLSDDRRVLLVSGSNMSGKSTLLRTVGINTVLAMAGAPVRAQRLRLTPLHIGASIRVNDSLQEGSSRFYAEITRLRAILDLAASKPPLLFLLDELLQGTNSNDRRVGAEGVVRALVNRGAIGLVSTHDLALAAIGGGLDGHLHNVHFQEEFEGGRMTFDYRLRDGVVTKSNGLALMRSIGLEV